MAKNLPLFYQGLDEPAGSTRSSSNSPIKLRRQPLNTRRFRLPAASARISFLGAMADGGTPSRSHTSPRYFHRAFPNAFSAASGLVGRDIATKSESGVSLSRMTSRISSPRRFSVPFSSPITADKAWVFCGRVCASSISVSVEISHYRGRSTPRATSSRHRANDSATL